MRASATLCHREMVRFLRQRSRVVGALFQPVLFWLLLGGGLRASFRPAGAPQGTGYAEYFYPGILALTLLFTAIFATISVVEDRKTGFLQGVLVSPVPRWSIVLGQAAGSTLLAVLQGALLLLLAPVAGLSLGVGAVLAALGAMTLLAFAMSAMGLVLAWRLDSTQGFHAIMNMVLMPMWLLSGAFFPAAGAPTWLAWLMRLNPMTYGLAALREGLYLGRPIAPGAVALPPMALCLAVLLACAGVCFATATALARRAAA